jgi:hypothetical protein
MTVSRRLVLLVVAGTIVLIAGLALLVVRLFEYSRAVQTNDAVCVISGALAELYQKKRTPKPEDVDDAIRSLIRTSVIDGKIGPDQKPLDPYGTPYRVNAGSEGSTRKVTVTSAGPDRIFDTADDIAHDTAWEQP